MTEADPGLLAVRDPLWNTEVGGLRHVEAGVEAEMVTPRKCNHRIPGPLYARREPDPRLPQYRGRQDALLVPQELPALGRLARKVAARQALEPRRVLLGHGVPVLGRAGVEVVDAEQVHVLRVRREGARPHPEVEVGARDAREVEDLVVPVPLGRIGPEEAEAALEPVNVPPASGGVPEERPLHVRAVRGRLHRRAEAPPEAAGEVVAEVVRVVGVELPADLALAVGVGLVAEV
mmetsp:Transcript_3126/g.7282  ORF Transcript_3126/g.7282 Transcript_3126/m.7282 type:complete len:234 (-) Transcript_3126:355-1056(-)